MNRKNKLFCTLIDFKQAFDTLWNKLTANGIKGKMFKGENIRNMYKGIKSMIKINDVSTNVFYL